MSPDEPSPQSPGEPTAQTSGDAVREAGPEPADVPDDPAALIDEQIRHTEQATTPRTWVFHTIWGVVWMLSAVIGLVAPSGTSTLLAIGILWVAGVITSGVYGARFGTGVHGGSRRTGHRYAITFTVGIAWAVLAAVLVTSRLPADVRLAVGLGIVLGVLAALGLAVSGVGVLPVGLLLSSVVLLAVPGPLALPLGAAAAGATLLVEAARLRQVTDE
ncbi:hypothetical protein [Microlunatus sp. Y2014]|uniref:hypothetical protein n=1 Tax=Microlunatus sp. Y2014 TaxID=3418488 RepID=UPI003DA71E63